MILFGWYSFLIKSYMLEELGFPHDKANGTMRVEVRQKCFHLFWIPFFGIGKIYGLCADGELYNLPDDMEHIVRDRMHHKTPWYTFIGLIAVTAIVIYMYVNDNYYKPYQYKKEAAQELAIKQEILTNPKIDDEYVVRTFEYGNDFYAMVTMVKSDSLLLNLSLKRKGGTYSYSKTKLALPEGEDEAVVAQEWITKDELLKAMPLDRETKKENLQFYIPELGGVKEFEINSIKRNDRTYW